MSRTAIRRWRAIDVEGELQRAKASLGTIPIVTIPDPAQPGYATLDAIAKKLRDGYDILYLVCHGAFIDNQARLYLANDAGQVKVETGDDFKLRLAELVQRPRLVVLASCQSAGDGTGSAADLAAKGPGGALTALGPLLADVGVPAVLAMQDKVTMETVEKFMPCFFEALRCDGQIDRAVAVARGKVRDRPDWWVPVLFMRLKSGRVGWYETGFRNAAGTNDFDRWPAVIARIKAGRCTPVLGPGLLESLIGPSREIARQWGDSFGFPMAPQNRDDLPQIAQYRVISQDKFTAQMELLDRFKGQLLARFKDQLPPDAKKMKLNALFSAVGQLRRKSDPAEAHKVLASLNLPLYISANPDNLLADALKEADKDPKKRSESRILPLE